MITDSLPVLIAYVDRNERYVFNNRAHEARFGVDSGGMQGRKMSEVLGDAALRSGAPVRRARPFR